MKTTLRILLFFPKFSNYSPAKEGEFVVNPNFGDRYVYEGRTLSVEEFNKLSEEGTIFERDRYSQPIRVKIVEELAKPAKPTEPEKVDGDGTTEPAKAENETETPNSETKQPETQPKPAKKAVKRAAK
jgi:hypothetical protein